MNNPWNRSANWRREEKDPGAHIRSIVRTILEIVPGGVLRAGKAQFGSGSGWLLDAGGANNTGRVDVGNPSDYIRFDGANLTWATPYTSLNEKGTLSAQQIEVEINAQQTYPTSITYLLEDEEVAELNVDLQNEDQITTNLRTQGTTDVPHAYTTIRSKAQANGVGSVNLIANAGAMLQTSLLLEAVSANNERTIQLTAPTYVAVHSPLLKLTAGAMQLEEFISPPGAPAANQVKLFAMDNGAGKTQLCARFATGAIQVIAAEP